MTNSITITYGRKVPGSQEYSSESLQITLTQDLGVETVEASDIRTAITALYGLVKEEVDKKLPVAPPQLAPRPQLPPLPSGHGAPTGPTPGFGQSNQLPHNQPNGNGNRFRAYGHNGNGNRPASPKQVNYMLGLANQRGLTFESLGQFLQEMTGKRDPFQLTPGEASKVIDSLKS